MCVTNTPTMVCYTPVHPIANRVGSGRATVISWCPATDRAIYRAISHYRLSPYNIRTMAARGENGEAENIFLSICRQVHCDFPEDPLFNAIVHPRLERHIHSLMNALDKHNIILLYTGPDNKQTAFWPLYTRTWANPNWDGHWGGIVSPQVRKYFAKVYPGGSLPDVTYETGGSVGGMRAVLVPAPDNDHEAQTDIPTPVLTITANPPVPGNVITQPKQQQPNTQEKRGQPSWISDMSDDETTITSILWENNMIPITTPAKNRDSGGRSVQSVLPGAGTSRSAKRRRHRRQLLDEESCVN
ncbi:hypothetical protein QBC47DRAFT_465507 [Echria macrotheca]|uniref:Uncharacterized protein n=1 Tax=Echria macrotheca TaxID=438768 RepID=A0AAJ0F3M6_9PEZI|nr:hypothetical protein QBC47DRAFT_465507 [Echria macrotheca]